MSHNSSFVEQTPEPSAIGASADAAAGNEAAARGDAAAARSNAAAGCNAAAPSSAPDCLSENLVVAFVHGHASEREWAQLEAHLDACYACTELVFAAAHVRVVASAASEPPWPTAFAVGSTLAERFTISRFVARGGMGEVYEAFDRKVPERVALKTMLCTLSDDPMAVRRLCEEVKLARRIAHRHVCRIHELHEHRDAPPSRAVTFFLAMEFVDGETLKERLSRGPIPPRVAGHIARQLLEGLGAAHAAGVLHLDFKSQNVMLRAGVSPAEAVIMDFSLSRAVETEARLQVSERQLVGSPGYMSPEQLECRAALGPASDIYALGVVLFEMLTGRLPFQSERAASMMAMQLERPAPTPSQVLPTLSAAFDPFVSKCLAKHPRDRFPDAASALAALDRCLVSPLERAAHRHRSLLRAASLLLLVVPLGTATWALGRFSVPARDTHVPSTEMRAMRPEPPADSAGAASLTPVGAAPPAPSIASAPGPSVPGSARLVAEPLPNAPSPARVRTAARPAETVSILAARANAPRPPPSAAAGPGTVGAASASAAGGGTEPDRSRHGPASASAGWTPRRAPGRLY